MRDQCNIKMICLIYGDNKDKAIAKTGELLKVLESKRPNSEIFEILASGWNKDHFDSLLKSQGLFDKKSIIVLKDVCSESDDIKSHVEKQLEEVSTSENVFVFVESKLDIKFLNSIKKVSKQTIEVKNQPKKDWRNPNDFALADAFGRRDAKSAWSFFNEGLMKGLEPEKLHGLIFWQLKTMLLASCTNSPVEADLSPFPYSKAKNFSKNFSNEELRVLSGKLVSLYHESRLGGRPLETSIEKFLLEI